MVDFDRKGFSAVDNFFGDSGELTQSVAEIVPKSLSQPHSSKTEPLWRQQQKRKRGNYDDDEVDNSLDTNQEDDDDEEGRTAISAVENKISLPPVEALGSKKKKKLGKKERAKLIAPAVDKKITQKESSSMEQQAPSTEAETKGNKRQKRRKVRSRQKNIRKDHRDVVPSHVKLRPLTPETRQKRNGVVVDAKNSPFSASKES